MTQTALILGQSGRFGHHATAAFQQAGWQVRVERKPLKTGNALSMRVRSGIADIKLHWLRRGRRWVDVSPRRVRYPVSTPGRAFVITANSSFLACQTSTSTLIRP